VSLQPLGEVVVAQLVLHMGTHKTGTTAIQQALSDARSSLRDRGTVYPDARDELGGSSTAHHRLAHALTGTDAGQLSAAHRFLERVADEAGPEETVVLSAEPFYRHVHGTRDTWRVEDYWPRRRCYLEGVASALERWEVTVLLYLRPPDDLAASLYLEAVAAGTCTSSFEQFLIDRRPFFDYSAQVRLLEETFDRIDVREYGPAIVDDVFAALGAGPPPPVPPRARLSPDPRLVLWLRDRPGRDAGHPEAERTLRRRFIHSRPAARRFAGRERVSLWESAAQRDGFLAGLDGAHGAERFGPGPATLPPLARLEPGDRAALDRRYRLWRLVERPRRWLTGFRAGR
jgi:hypothetical protein